MLEFIFSSFYHFLLIPVVYIQSFTFHACKHVNPVTWAGWVSGWAEDVLLNNMKNTLQKRDTDPKENKGKLDKRVQSRLLSDFYDAQKKEFELKNLSKDEICFLFEYVCN